MFSHVTLGTSDIARAIAFYGRVLAPLGLARRESDIGKGHAGYATAPETTPLFWVLRPIDGEPAGPGNGVTIAFEAPDHGRRARRHPGRRRDGRGWTRPAPALPCRLLRRLWARPGRQQALLRLPPPSPGLTGRPGRAAAAAGR
jgi:catechol 2,3-dioxygenase-like lactoylglutathione lyase family enzyme